MKRTILSRADKLEAALQRLETQVKDPLMINKLRIMAEDISKSSDFVDLQRRKGNEQQRIAQETTELHKIMASLKSEENAAAQLRAQTDAEVALTEKDAESGRKKLAEAEEKERAEILKDEKLEEEREQRQRQLVDDAKRKALEAAANENSVEQAAAEAAAAAAVEKKNEEERAAEAKARAEAAERRETDDENTKEELARLKEE